MMKAEVKQIVDNAEKMPLTRGLAYFNDILRDINMARIDMRIRRMRKKPTVKDE